MQVEREVKALIRAEHPNIVQYYAIENDGQHRYLVMELCTGDLCRMIESTDAQQKPKHCHELVTATAHLHSSAVNLAHRDIKPQNVLYTEGAVRVIKLCDFGLAKTVAEHTMQTHTQGVGSWQWMAPELFTNESKANLKAADIFSLGCVLYYLLTDGYHPFMKGKTGWSMQIKYTSLDVTLASPTAQHLLTHMLHRDPQSRPSAEWCSCHPLFWPPSKSIELCQTLRESLEKRPDERAHLEEIVGPSVNDWFTTLTKNKPDNGEWDFTKHIHQRYSRTDAFTFIVFVRNVWSHFKADCDGATPFATKERLCMYFLDLFPDLPLALSVFTTAHLHTEPEFSKYCMPTSEKKRAMISEATSNGILGEPLLAAMPLTAGRPDSVPEEAAQGEDSQSQLDASAPPVMPGNNTTKTVAGIPDGAGSAAEGQPTGTLESLVQQLNMEAPPALISDLDLLALAFARLPFRFIGIIAQVSRLWCQFAADTHWMRERVCFSFGSGKSNGHGEDKDAPTLLALSMRSEVRSVVCGHATTFFLCGRQSFWLGESWSTDIPDAEACRELILPSGAAIAHIACTVPGYHHSRRYFRYHVAAIGADRALYTWGQNQFGQLFHTRANQVLEPELVMHPGFEEGAKVLDVSCGVHFSMLLTESNAKQSLWVCGPYVAESMHDMGPVRQVELPETGPPLLPQTIARVHCGGFFAALLTQDGKCAHSAVVTHQAVQARCSLLGALLDLTSAMEIC